MDIEGCFKLFITIFKFNVLIAHYSNFLNDQRKKNARLGRKERDFMDNVEIQIIQKSLMRWKSKSQILYDEEVKLLMQMKEEELNRRR